MKVKYLLSFWIWSISLLAMGQGQEEKNWAISPDIHYRSFWMNTAYPRMDYRSDHALGMSLNLGTKIHYQDNWELGVGYRMYGNVVSTEFWTPDPVSGKASRYEPGLFDLQNPQDRIFGTLERLYLGYEQNKFGVKIGRMGINQDWVNAQDGRLGPTMIEGLHTWFQPEDSWKFSLWAIHRFSIRGGKGWLSPGETIGLFPSGRSESGTASAYAGKTQSPWVGILEIDRDWQEGWTLHYSNTLAANLFNTSMLQIEKTRKMENSSWRYGLQLGYQAGIGDGGDEHPDFRYKNPDDRNYSFSTRILWKPRQWTMHLNYTHVDGKGRWLSPREWGKDAWYTFIPRERNEGNSQLDALTAYIGYKLVELPLSFYTWGGLHWLPDMADAEANKYNMPSYRQLNLGMKYQPKNIKGLDVHLILVNKEPMKKEGLTDGQIFNKVEMLHFNAMLNWRWN
ncbi:hypothetical protein KZP23_13440 [Echinicola marina]|uniref:hypothetical protein n=1 Tax=Echinicola marina TaxID=2859768 RepID=UPI001CF6B964|nr:hypothetical protein [Echinicola marina]UCS91746.1 hypothetical protein KZP23_13440 [Echinicola marina]